MSLLVDRPSNVIRRFWELYKEDPVKATDAHYKFSQDTDYIRRYRIAKDMKWVAPTEYGDLDITINLSKPEKRSESHRSSKAGKTDIISKMSALHGKRRLRRTTEPSGKTEPQNHTGNHQQQ